ncbi:zinc finger protein 260-like [Condylostylus longicornis]|uniref:zinc finger protein 260-like n=1 Tax=Condylostylus longicornis TaxID=2530218 RepID=UPI00244DBE7C|nr:zinc finger protein 260-like [Condylostylus longicornis]
MKTRSKLKSDSDNSQNIVDSEKIVECNSDKKNLNDPIPITATDDQKTEDQDKEKNSTKNISKKAKLYFVIKDNLFVLSCVGCKCTFPDVPDFLNHVCSPKDNGSKKKSVSKPCRTLEESIGTETNLIIGEDGLWHCRICDKGYEKKNSLKKHEQAHLFTFTCEICGKGLKSSVNLREHMNVHSGVRPYKCHLCPMTFARKWGLTSHVRSHIGDKRYSCEHCEKKFINGAILKIHVRMVHTKEKPCQCELCGQHFYSNQLLKEHKKRHLNIRPYKCEYENCGKSFYDKKQLNRHYVSHSDEKPFKCTFNNCDAKFARQKTLQAHLKIHSGVKDHLCTICGKGFAMNYNLTSHMKSHANGKLKVKKKDLSTKRKNSKKNKKINIGKNVDMVYTEIKEELENSEQRETILMENKSISDELKEFIFNDTFNESENKIAVNTNNIGYNNKNFANMYDNMRNSVPLVDTSIPVPFVDEKLKEITVNQINENISILDLPQEINIENQTSTEGVESTSNNVSLVVTMDHQAFLGNNILHIYQIPN